MRPSSGFLVSVWAHSWDDWLCDPGQEAPVSVYARHDDVECLSITRGRRIPNAIYPYIPVRPKHIAQQKDNLFHRITGEWLYSILNLLFFTRVVHYLDASSRLSHPMGSGQSCRDYRKAIYRKVYDWRVYPPGHDPWITGLHMHANYSFRRVISILTVVPSLCRCACHYAAVPWLRVWVCKRSEVWK